MDMPHILTPDEKLIWHTLIQSESCDEHPEGGIESFGGGNSGTVALVCCEDFKDKILVKFRNMAIGKDAKESSVTVVSLR